MMKKRILIALLCGVILASATACNTSDKSIDQSVETTIENPMENPTEKPVEIPTKNPEGVEVQFLSKQVKESWRSPLLSFLSTHDRSDYLNGIGGSYAMGLMDLDFDNVPEVLIAHPGGSMGNVYLMIYDLATGENLTDYNAGYFGKGTDVCFSVAFQNGMPVVLEEGNMRALDIGYLDRIKVLPKTVKTLEKDARQLFAASEADGYYAVDGQEVEKSEYEAKYQQFWQEYEKIEATTLRLIRWGTVESDTPEKTAEKMVDALINSSQAFIDYTKQPTEKPTEKTSVFGDYQDLLGTLVLLQQENGLEKFRAEHPTLDEREESILLSLCNVDVRALGYCVKDVTGDGKDELLLLNSGEWIRTIYTLHEGKPAWIKDFCRGGVKDGVLYDETNTKDATMRSRSYSIGKIVNGKYEEVSSFGYSYVFDKDEYQDVFLIENQETIKTDMKTVESKIHAFPGFPHNTREEGVTYTRLFEDGTTVEDEGKHYRITKTNGVYKLEIFDKDGNLAFSKRSLGSIYCRVGDGDLLSFEYSDSSDPHCYFYSVSKNQLSQKFRNVVSKRDELVVYTKTDGAVPLLVVQNIFDKTAFYKEFECPKSLYSANFSPDGKSIEITFSGASGKPGKRVFCFETLPILRVTTICYVRYSTSVHDDVYYISSGNPALLRPANEDTVRLLETLEGGTYKDADGNERNDWHKIVYNGRELYVTADSFEVLTYEVK